MMRPYYYHIVVLNNNLNLYYSQTKFLIPLRPHGRPTGGQRLFEVTGACSASGSLSDNCYMMKLRGLPV
jgi:hypothetical protein